MNKKIKKLAQIMFKYETFIFDLDGVIWRGEELIKGSIETLHELRKYQKKIYFVTNSSVRSRQTIQKRLAKFGFMTQLSSIIGSSYATGLYLRQMYPNINKIVMVGSDDMQQELQKYEFDLKNIKDIDENKNLQQIVDTLYDETRQAFVLGYDRYLNYAKICLISIYLQKGAKFLVTNADKATIINGYRMPGTGSILKAIQQGSKVSAQIVGKPNKFIMNYLISRDNLQRSSCIMIGDNLQTDILFAHNSKIDSLCMLTGVTSELQLLSNKLGSTYYSSSLI